MKGIRAIIKFLFICSPVFSGQIGASHAGGLQFPLVFDRAESAEAYGLGVNRKRKDFLGCYYYGDGGPTLSISPGLLDVYKSQGFSRRSACMAISSGIRFNPETGARLATITFTDPDALAGNQDYSGELPISLPSCFRSATPYSDCQWNFDPISGRSVPKQDRAKFKKQGESYISQLGSKDFRSNFGYYKNFEGGPESIPVGGAQRMLQHDKSFPRFYNFIENRKLPAPLERVNPPLAAYYDYSSDFPRGFGYALYTSGEAGPSGMPVVARAVAAGKRPPAQVNPSELRSILNAGR